MLLPLPLRRSGAAKPWPSFPKINWRHPLARGLVSYCYDIGSGPYDLVTGGPRTIITAAGIVAAQSSKYGAGLLYSSRAAAGSGIATLSLPTSAPIATLTNAAPYSYACGLMYNTAPAVFASGTSLFCTCDGTASTPLITAAAVTSVTDFAFGFANGSYNVTAAGLGTVGVFHTLLGVALTAATTACYVDGVLAISPAVTTTFTLAGSKPYFAGYDNSSTSQTFPNAWIYYGALWKRALSANEARQLHDDPYCFLIYPEDEMFAEWVGAAAAAAVQQKNVSILQAVKRASYW